MSDVERLFSEPAGPTVVNCDWCGSPAVVCAFAEVHTGGTPARLGFCEDHHRQLLDTGDGTLGGERAAYERRRTERDAEVRRQRTAWRKRKAARQAAARGRDGARGAPPGDTGASAGAALSVDPACPRDSEELVAAILAGERPVSPVASVDPRLEDPARRVERLQKALWPLVKLAEECGIYVDCNPSQRHSVMIVGEVPVQALFQARDLLKHERER